MISLQNLEGAVPNKPDNSNTNFFNRLTKLVVRKTQQEFST